MVKETLYVLPYLRDLSEIKMVDLLVNRYILNKVTQFQSKPKTTTNINPIYKFNKIFQ